MSEERELRVKQIRGYQGKRVLVGEAVELVTWFCGFIM